MNEKRQQRRRQPQQRQHEVSCAALEFALVAITRSNAPTTFSKLYPSILFSEEMLKYAREI